MTILTARFFFIPAEAGIQSLSMILDFKLFHERTYFFIIPSITAVFSLLMLQNPSKKIPH